MSYNFKKIYLLSIIVCMIPIVAGAIFYNQLPDQIATHWDFSGTPNGWSNKFVGVIVFPGILFIINLLFPFIIKMDPKNQNLSEKIMGLIQWIMPFVTIFASSITLMSAMGITVKVQLISFLFIGLLFVIIGNYLPKISQSYTVGIKVPWTLHDEENWNKTHRFSGFLWVVCGLIMMITAFLPSGFQVICFIVVLVATTLVPTIYSYILYVSKNRYINK